jgi:uroporphyrin-3 C-methyltransferase
VIKQQAAALAEANSKQEELAKQLDEVQQKVATISGTDAKTWLLAQADFLVKLAGRKLWSDQDVTTAAALLKSADASLADMNDPSLITARRAITEDIASLSAVSQVDYDGIILKVNQLSNQIDNLRWRITTTTTPRWIPTVPSFPAPERMARKPAEKLAELYGQLYHHPPPR